MKTTEKDNANNLPGSSIAIDALFADAIAKVRNGAVHAMAANNTNSKAHTHRLTASMKARFHEQIATIWAQAQKAIAQERAHACDVVDREAKYRTEVERRISLLTEELDKLKSQFAEKEEIHAEQMSNIKAETERTVAEERTRADEATDKEIKCRVEVEGRIASLTEELDKLKSQLAEKEEIHAEQMSNIKVEAERTLSEEEARAEDAVKRETEFRTEAEGRIASLTEELDELKARLAETEELHAEQISNTEAEAERTLSEEKARADQAADEVVRIKEESEATVAQLKAEHEEQVIRIKQEYEESIAAIHAEFREQISKLVAEADHATARQEVGPQSERMQGTVISEIPRTAQEVRQSPPNHQNEQPLPLRYCARDIMQGECVWGNPEDSVEETLRKMQQFEVRYVLIGQDKQLEGIVSKSDLQGAVSFYLRPQFAKWRQPLDDATLRIKVKWIMSRPVHVTSPDVSLATIIRNMSRLDVCVLPVLDRCGKVIGVVTEAAIFEAILMQNNEQQTCPSQDGYHTQAADPQVPDHARTPPTKASLPSPVPA